MPTEPVEVHWLPLLVACAVLAIALRKAWKETLSPAEGSEPPTSPRRRTHPLTPHGDLRTVGERVFSRGADNDNGRPICPTCGRTVAARVLGRWMHRDHEEEPCRGNDKPMREEHNVGEDWWGMLLDSADATDLVSTEQMARVWRLSRLDAQRKLASMVSVRRLERVTAGVWRVTKWGRETPYFVRGAKRGDGGVEA